MFTPYASDLPVVFLDIDETVGNSRAQDGIGQWLDPVAMGLLRKIVVTAGAKIVVTSTWRSSAIRCHQAFHDHDLLDYIWSPIIGGPGDWRVLPDNTSRSHNISQWLADHPQVARWVILDDSLSDLTPYQLQRLVHVDFVFGLSSHNVVQALKILGDAADDDGDSRTPRLTLSSQATLALDALDQGDHDSATMLLKMIADHPLAQ